MKRINCNPKMEVDRVETSIVGSTELGGDRRDIGASENSELLFSRRDWVDSTQSLVQTEFAAGFLNTIHL